ncbi:MAG: hypothetical protein A2Y33_10970 [Spirochaetes bacterium GWF1_51_8]|nr:MAG: hypothetical protein A2Y33_10970 [Spirochaetes bacterium GWF1_51_8]
MNVPAFLREERADFLVRFTVNKTQTLFELLRQTKNTLLITGSPYYTGFFQHHLRKMYNSMPVYELELGKNREITPKSLIKLRNPYILITDYFPEIDALEIERIVYFRVPLRIQGLLSDMNQMKRGKAPEMILIIDPDDYAVMTDRGDDADAVRMYEWVSGRGSLLPVLDDNSIDENRSERGKTVPGELGLKLLVLAACSRNGITIGRIIELGQGMKSGDLFFPGYGTLRGVPRDRITEEVFRLKNEGFLEFKKLGNEIMVKAAGVIAQGIK